MSRFFIERPVFAAVIAIAVMLAGYLAVRSLPISQYPQISPTTVSISASYVGADAETVENSVTKVIEEGMTGIDHLDYLTSTSSANGTAQITLTFTNDANPDIAQMQVQNKLQLVEPQLPQEVRTQGISVTKSSEAFIMVLGFVSTNGQMTSTDLADYVENNLNERIKRLPGVGSTRQFGSAYAMRIWLDPAKLRRFDLMPQDVVTAIEEQNTQVSAGQLGGLPQVEGQQINVTLTTKSRMQTVEEFENIILKSDVDGAVVRIADIAEVELGSETYETDARYNHMPATGLAVYLASGANAIETSDAVKATVAEFSPTLPAGVEVVYPNDTTPFVRLSIEGVVHTLIEAVVLVFVVMFVFLQNLRATLIPTLAIPVVLLGTFGVLAVFGYSINTLTMFAMVLAIGLLVDDAIVVVENVERLMDEEGLSPKQATIESMKEISGALVGIGVVLSAVFVPMAFFSGSVGVIYRQFSVTIVTAMILSVLVALILTPALCAILLKPVEAHRKERGLFGLFNRGFDRTTQGYVSGVKGMLRRKILFVGLFVLVIGGVAYLFGKVPSSFVPEEDQGILFSLVQLPQGATREQTREVITQGVDYFLEQEGEYVQGVMGVAGFGFSGMGQNVGLVFVSLKPFDEREGEEASAQAIAGRAQGYFRQFKDAQVFALAPPPIRGFNITGGFDLYLQDIGNEGHEALKEIRDRVLQAANESPLLVNTRENGQPDTAQYHIEIDADKASAYTIALSDIDATLSTGFGGRYVNDFNYEENIKPVYVQGKADARMQPDDIDKWFVRNREGEMVPVDAVADGEWRYASPRLQRFNAVPAIQLQGEPAPGVTSGEAMDEIERIIEGMPAGYGLEWVGLSYQERIAGDQAAALYAMSILVVFLALAALYESWTTPLAVMLTVPVGVLGALLAAWSFGQPNDVYFKVGLLTTAGLSAKNAILIVEFAVAFINQGKGLIEATLEAARMRLRPILMTSFAFVLGVTPLALASGAGSGSQNAVGIGVVGGMISATILGIFFSPLLFVVVRRIFSRGTASSETADQDAQ